MYLTRDSFTGIRFDATNHLSVDAKGTRLLDHGLGVFGPTNRLRTDWVLGSLLRHNNLPHEIISRNT